MKSNNRRRMYAAVRFINILFSKVPAYGNYSPTQLSELPLKYQFSMVHLIVMLFIYYYNATLAFLPISPQFIYYLNIRTL